MGTTRRLDRGLRLRRSRRTDVTRLRALLPDRGGARAERFDRRTLAGLGQDVYVAEAPGGAIVGVVAVGYLRSLREGRHTAVLETARVAPDTGLLLEALLDLAEERARHRGCRHVRAWPGADDAALRSALTVRGWRGDEALVGTVTLESNS